MDNSDIFLRSGIDKQLKIYTGDRSISFTNSDLYFQEFQLEESICDEESIKFGYLHASSIQFKVANSFIPLKSKWLKVDFVLDKDDSNTYPVGKFKVAEDTPAADRRYRTVKCYDALYDVINADVSAWYNALFSTDDTKVTLKTFRNSFFSYFGIEQTDISLVNDAIVIDKTISPDELSGKVVLSAILELNGCLGHIGRDAKFHYIYLEQEIQGLYPRDDLYPADDLYPRDVKTSPIGKSVYKKCEYQDFITKSIDKLQIRKEENDIGIVIGSGNNAYVIEDNFLVYGKSASDLEIIANNIFKKIAGIRYRPFKAECIGNLLFDLGKPIRLVTKYEMIETYILSRTLTGIQQLSDSYSAKGTEYQQQKINSTAKSIKELKGKTNTLFRSVEETRLEIKDLDQNLSSKITQNAQKIELEVTRATSAENNLSSRITQTAEQISLEVTRATTAESSLSAAIQVNANNISSKVSKNNIVSEINQSAEQIQISASKINLKGAVVANGWVIEASGGGIYNGIPYTGKQDSNSTGMGSYGSDWAFWAGNGKFSVNQSGHVYAQDVDIKGKVTATEGKFENVSIEKSCTIAGRTFGSEFTWNGSGITEDYISSVKGSALTSEISNSNVPNLSSKQLSSCYATGAFGFGGGTSNCVTLSDGRATLQGVSSAALKSNFKTCSLGSLGLYCDGNITAYGNLSCEGTKNRIIKTKEFGTVCVSAYETATPLFGDVGKSIIEEDGSSIIWIDPVFYETVETDCDYNVFLTKYGEGDIWCDMINSTKDYFVVKGTPGLEFVWEIKLIQRGLKNTRLTEHNIDNAPISESIDYIHEADMYIKNFEGELDYAV